MQQEQWNYTGNMCLLMPSMISVCSFTLLLFSLPPDTRSRSKMGIVPICARMYVKRSNRTIISSYCERMVYDDINWCVGNRFIRVTFAYAWCCCGPSLDFCLGLLWLQIQDHCVVQVVRIPVLQTPSKQIRYTACFVPRLLGWNWPWVRHLTIIL